MMTNTVNGCPAEHAFRRVYIIEISYDRIILLWAGALVVFVLPQQEGAERTPRRLKTGAGGQRVIRIGLNMGRYPSEQEAGWKLSLRNHL